MTRRISRGLKITGSVVRIGVLVNEVALRDAVPNVSSFWEGRNAA